MNKGLVLPNWEWFPYTQEEISALYDLKPSTLIWILYDDNAGSINLAHKTQLLPYIQEYNPRIIYRPYRGDIALINPRIWASKCAALIHQLGMPGEFIPANELNIEGMGEEWSKHIKWLKAVHDEWEKVSLETVNLIHLPALSPIDNYKEGYDAYGDAGLYDLFDVADEHRYTLADSGHITHLPICITEFNQMDPHTVFVNLSNYARDVCYFLLGGTADQSKYDILKNKPYYDSFRI